MVEELRHRAGPGPLRRERRHDPATAPSGPGRPRSTRPRPFRSTRPKGPAVPLVRIDVTENRRTPEQLRALADVVQDVMLDTFAAPPRDRYQIITEHRPGQIIAEDTGLGLTRTDDLVVVQVVQQGRSEAQKQAMYRALADRLEQRTGLDPQDLIVSVTENTREDWSFGRGVAQFLTGEL
nr:tautomerase family protein [Kocuria sediminis]